MNSYLSLPLVFLKFWFFDAPKEIVAFFASLNRAFFQMLSLPLLLRTFFKPLKNEYRKGLVGFSRGIGIVVKTFLIIVNLVVLVPLLFFEITSVILFVLFPVMTVVILFM